MDGIRKSHRQHEGERRVQARRHAPPDLHEMVGRVVDDEMSRERFAYYRRLAYLPLGVSDAAGRLWATVLAAPEISAPDRERLRVTARVHPDDPFVRAVCSPVDGARAFAAVAIDFASRSRVKIAGNVEAATLDGQTLTLVLRTNEHMGNCPKYITARELRPLRRTAHTTALGQALSPAALELLGQASTVFVATRHSDRDPRESDMGFNHRGGPRGFVRYFEDAQGSHLVLPDYSGNRFYQSLGNVETDPVMGIVALDFTTGAMLQVSGRARNLFDEEASRVMPGATLITVVSIDEAFLTAGALDLELASEEQLSPYNPRRRLLASEAPGDERPFLATATLVDVTKESSHVSTFTFSLPTEADLVPGGHAIFDFSAHVGRSYQHMNDRDPRSLNDDLVRSFTVSKVSPDRRRISITVKKAGVVSSFLHSLAGRPGDEPVEVELKGFGGTFTCFDDGRPIQRMLWVAGGVGITPFLAMYRALRDAGGPMPDIQLLYACRRDEVALIREMTDIDVTIFDTRSPVERAPVGRRSYHRRRLRASDLDDPSRHDRTVFVCGPAGFMADVRSWLDGRVDPAQLRFESFDF